MTQERKMKRREVDTLDVDDYKLSDFLAQVQKLIARHGADALVEKKYYSYSDEQYIAVTAEFPETDQEMDARIRQEEFYAARRAKNERAEFERLKAKFGE